MNLLITLRDFLIYLFFLTLSIPFRMLPYPRTLKLGVAMVRCLFPLFPRYRRIAIENISKAFPELDSERHEAIFQNHLNHLGYLLADTFWKSRMTQRWFDTYVKYTESARAMERRLLDGASKGQSFILVTGHVGSWENVAQFIGYRLHGAIVYKTIRNRFLDRWFRKHRGAPGTGLFTMEETSALVKYMKNGGIVGLASDQNAGSAGIFIDFMNRPASTYRGPATIAYLTGAPLIFITMIHQGNGNVDLNLEDLGSLNARTSGEKDRTIREGTELWVHALENAIRRTPGQYFWVHRRWKTTPAMLTNVKQRKSAI